MNVQQRITIFAACALLVGCSSDDSTNNSVTNNTTNKTTTNNTTSTVAENLPSGWESAHRVTDLSQTECSDVPEVRPDEIVEINAGQGNITLSYRNFNTLCDSQMEGFYRASDATVDVLVRPVEFSGAMCMCLYDLEFELSGLEAGETSVNVYTPRKGGDIELVDGDTVTVN